jgi:hypothetical protein
MDHGFYFRVSPLRGEQRFPCCSHGLSGRGRQKKTSVAAQAGRGRITTLAIIACATLFGCTIWIGMAVLYRFYDFRNRVEHIVSSAEVFSDLELRKKIQGVIKGAGISLDEQGIVVTRDERMAQVDIAYRHAISVVVAGKRATLVSIPLRMRAEKALKFVTDEQATQ